MLPLLLAAALDGAAPQRLPDPPLLPPLTDDALPSATIEDAGLRLNAQFGFDAGKRLLRLRYLLHNGSRQAVALFDRGNSLAVTQGRLKAGSAAAPTTESTTEGLVLHHRIVPLRKPAPTVPPVPLAARVAPGAELGGDVLVEVGGATRLRYCLGVAPFEPALFSSRQAIDGVELWRSSFDAVDKQKTLCTPWFDTAGLDFESR